MPGEAGEPAVFKCKTRFAVANTTSATLKRLFTAFGRLKMLYIRACVANGANMAMTSVKSVIKRHKNGETFKTLERTQACSSMGVFSKTLVL
jgi:hypothetical protein